MQRLLWPHSTYIETVTGVHFIGYISMQCCVVLVTVQLAKCLRRHFPRHGRQSRSHRCPDENVVPPQLNVLVMAGGGDDPVLPVPGWPPCTSALRTFTPPGKGSDHSCPRAEGHLHRSDAAGLTAFSQLNITPIPRTLCENHIKAVWVIK